MANLRDGSVVGHKFKIPKFNIFVKTARHYTPLPTHNSYNVIFKISTEKEKKFTSRSLPSRQQTNHLIGYV